MPFLPVFFIVIGVLFAIFLWMLKKITRRDEIWRSLNMRLFLVRLPKEASREEMTREKIHERISVMENVYASLALVHDTWWNTFSYGKPVFALEITTPHIGEEISFYTAVPKRFQDSFEKIIHANYPHASVSHVKDYNIFNPAGKSVVSEITQRRPFAFPVKVYRDIPGDPLRAITNVFSKLQREGEGASLQIIARPASGRIRRSIQYFAKEVQLGDASIRRGPRAGVMRMGSIFKESLFPPSEEEIEKRKTKRLTPAEEELLRKVEQKSGRTLFDANIRLVASAPNEARAGEILSGLESAFTQFSDPASNECAVYRPEKSGLKDAIYRFSFRVFSEPERVVLSGEELAGIFHFPNTALETPKIEFLKAREAPSPANLPTEGLLLGVNDFRGIASDIRIMKDDPRRHMYIIGQTGTGKSVLLKNMIRQDIESGEGVCFIDPHGDTVEEILGYIPEERSRDVIYFNPADTARPLGLNMLEYDTRYPEQKTMVVNELFSIFMKLYGAIPESMGPMFEQYFRNSTLLVMDDPASGSTLLEISRVLSDRAFRELKLSRTKNIVVRSFWEKIAEKAGGESSLANIVPYITSKFDTFLANEIMRPIIAQERSAFNFREVMDQKKILLINLSKGRLGEINSSLLGLIIVGKLLIASLSRTDIPEESRSDFYLYLDEFQNVTTPSIATILSEARKYRLNLTISHQFIGQLEENIKKAVFGNAGSMAAFRIGSDDAEFMEKQFAPIFSAHDLLNIDNYNCYVKLLIRGQTSESFSMKTHPPQAPYRDQVERIKEFSRQTYGRQRDEVEREILERHS